jgi:hypothetical protein
MSFDWSESHFVFEVKCPSIDLDRSAINQITLIGKMSVWPWNKMTLISFCAWNTSVDLDFILLLKSNDLDDFDFIMPLNWPWSHFVLDIKVLQLTLIFCQWNQVSFSWHWFLFFFKIKCPSIGLDYILSLK